MNFVVFFVLLVVGQASTEEFEDRTTFGQIQDVFINEASGMAASWKHKGVIYTHNDKEGRSQIYAVHVETGEKLATITVQGATNYDWEDLAYGPCYDDCKQTRCSASVDPSRYCIYISDTGDHGKTGAANIIYAIREPDVLSDQVFDVIGKLEFTWDEFNTETLLIAPDSSLYVISKVRGGHGKVAHLPATAWNADRITLDKTRIATLKLSTTWRAPTGGDISHDGKYLVLVGDLYAWFYKFDADDMDYVSQLGRMQPQKIMNYETVKNTGAVAWSATGPGFYTLAEMENPYIYYYARSIQLQPI